MFQCYMYRIVDIICGEKDELCVCVCVRMCVGERVTSCYDGVFICIRHVNTILRLITYETCDRFRNQHACHGDMIIIPEVTGQYNNIRPLFGLIYTLYYYVYTYLLFDQCEVSSQCKLLQCRLLM